MGSSSATLSFRTVFTGADVAALEELTHASVELYYIAIVPPLLRFFRKSKTMAFRTPEADSGIKDREREFHDRRFAAAIDPRASLSKYYSVTCESKELYRATIRTSAPSGSRVLEYGCGDVTGNIPFYKLLNCEFYGIDISPEAIKKARTTAEDEDFSARYSVEDAESTNLPSDFFDLAMGSGILHHLNIDRAMKELRRVTKQAGCCVFFEPLGHNPLINLFRSLTPKVRSSDEHPLREEDFETMARYFRRVEVSYFHFFALGAVIFRRTGLFNRLLEICSRLDAYLTRRYEWFGKFCWICVIRLSQPIKNSDT